MSGQEDFGALLEVLVACVAAIDLFSIIGFTKKCIDDEIESPMKINNKRDSLTLKNSGERRESTVDHFNEFNRAGRSRSVSKSPLNEHSSYDDETSALSESREGSTKHPQFISRDDEFINEKLQLVSDETFDQSKKEEIEEFINMKNEESDDFETLSYDDFECSYDESPPIENNSNTGFRRSLECSPEPVMSPSIEIPVGDIKKETAEMRKQEKIDQLRRSSSIDEQSADEAKAPESSPRINIDMNKKFIEMERNVSKQDSDVPIEVRTGKKDVEKIPSTARIADKTGESLVDVARSDGIQLDQMSDIAIKFEKRSISHESIAPDGSDFEKIENFEDKKSNDKLKRSKRCIDSLDRSPSRSSSRHNHIKRNPSVASEQDYKEWFDRFDNHITPNLTVPNLNDHFDSDDEDDFLNIKYKLHTDETENCETDDACMEDSIDVSVSVTLNLRKPQGNLSSSKCITMSEQPRQSQKRLSIVPSTEDQQQSYVSILHPENFTENEKVNISRSDQHYQKASYNEWIKKIVDHQSSHLSTSDSESDSDVSLDEIRMLPLFCSQL